MLKNRNMTFQKTIELRVQKFTIYDKCIIKAMFPIFIRLRVL